MKAVIMCGGSGTRLWPISRKSSPKQFVPLFNQKSLFELTIERNLSFVNEFIIVVNEAQLNLCQSQIPQIIKDKVKFIIEPIGRNTAPAITLAALLANDSDLLILASDHLIENQDAYKSCVAQALELSRDTSLVTFGITPTYPETGYGYIEANDNKVVSFKEKPNLETAKDYLAAGNYFWNSGMFFFNAKAYTDELDQFNPEILKHATLALKQARVENNIYYIEKEDMIAIPEDSIDYAVMEKSEKVKVVPSDIGWSDLGSFDSLYEHLEKDKDGNTINHNHLQLNSNNNLILGDKRIIATFDVENLLIIDTPNALLIGKKGESQKVKDLLKKVKERDPSLLE